MTESNTMCMEHFERHGCVAQCTDDKFHVGPISSEIRDYMVNCGCPLKTRHDRTLTADARKETEARNLCECSMEEKRQRLGCWMPALVRMARG